MKKKTIKAWAIISDFEEMLWLEVAEEIKRKNGIINLIFYAPAIFQRKKDAGKNILIDEDEKVVPCEIILNPHQLK